MADKARRDAADREAGARAEGEARGVAKGRAEGEVTGALRNARENALNFLRMGLDPASVSKGTDLPLEEVLALAGNLRQDPGE